MKRLTLIMDSQVKFGFNSTLNNSTSQHEDYFQAAFDDIIWKTSAIVISVPTFLFIIFGLFGIIWYERYGSDVRRVLLNRLITSICWVGLEYFFIASIIDIVRYILGPLPTLLCFCQMILKNSIHLQAVLFSDAIIVVRYAFYFWLKNTSEFQDEFWCSLISMWVVCFSFLSQFVYAFLPGGQPLNYFICTGQDPSLEPQKDVVKTNYVHNYVIPVSIIIQTFVAVKISIHKIKVQCYQPITYFHNTVFIA